MNLAMANTNYFIVRNGLQVGNTAVMDSNGFWVNPNRLTVANTQQSTSNVTGSLVVGGGAGVKGALWVDNIYVYGTVYNAQTLADKFSSAGGADPGQILFSTQMISGGDL